MSRVSVITGTTSGIGRIVARELGRDGCTVVMVCRNAEKAERTRDLIRRETSNPRMEIVLADLSSLADVRRAGEEIIARWPRIDLLVNNAGVISADRAMTVDGFEITFAVNHLAPFLLTNLLLGRLESSAGAAASRVVNVSSHAHVHARLNLDDLEGRRGYDGFRAYCNSKLCNILFTYELARRLDASKVTANCVHPGRVATGFGRRRRGLFGMRARISAWFLMTPEQGARSTLYLARSPEVEAKTGRYYDEEATETPSSPISHDAELGRKLWEISRDFTGVG